MNKKELFIDTLNGNICKQKPIWFMRQAGRFLKKYRILREKHSFLTMCTTPELSAKATMLPLEEIDVDAMILFSDILIPLKALGAQLSYKDGVPPVVNNLDLNNLVYNQQNMESVNFVAETIKIIKHEINDTALIGFAAAPFTLGCYMFGSSGDFYKIRSFIYRSPDKFLKIMGILTQLTIDYLKIQIHAGVDAIQLFDSWAGIVPYGIYKNFIYPFNEQIAKSVSFPSIYYIKNSSHINDLVVNLDFDCLSVDWRQDLNYIHSKSKRCVQGNMDNTVLLADRDTLKRETLNLISKTKNIPHIFNLGHGILPQTQEDMAKLLVDLVHKNS